MYISSVMDSIETSNGEKQALWENSSNVDRKMAQGQCRSYAAACMFGTAGWAGVQGWTRNLPDHHTSQRDSSCFI